VLGGTSLFLATTGGVVIELPIEQDVRNDTAKTIKLGNLKVIDKGDRRGVTSIKWMKVSLKQPSDRK